MQLLKVVSIAETADKTGLAYKKVGFEPVSKDGNMEVLTNDATRFRNLWPERTLADGSKIKADPLFAKIKLGSIVAGHIETVPTTPYALENNTVATYTGVFFSNENVTTVTNRNLRSYNAFAVDAATGEVIGQPNAVPEAGATPLITSGVPKEEEQPA